MTLEIASKASIGILPARHHEKDFDLSLRHVLELVQVRKLADSKREYIEVEDDSRGDWLGFTLWRPSSGAGQAPGPGPGGGGGSSSTPRGGVVSPASGPVVAKTLTREAPAWANAWPTVIVDVEGGGAGGGTTGGTSISTISRDQVKVSGQDPEPPEQRVRPIRDGKGSADLRFERKAPGFPDWASRFPKDWTGQVLSATEEHDQVETWHPDALGIVAVNRAGSPTVGTRVFETTDESKVDPDRWAYFHTFGRVVRPRGRLWEGNGIAWQLGPAGGQDLRAGYGLVYGIGVGMGGAVPAPESDPADSGDSTTVPRFSDFDVKARFTGGRGSSAPRIGDPGRGGQPAGGGLVAAAAVQAGGPMDLGGLGCPHVATDTLDGEKVYSLHSSTQTLFRGQGGDGTINFEAVHYTHPDPLPHRAPAHLRWNPQARHRTALGTYPGRWDFECEVPTYLIKYPPFPPFPPPVPPGGPGGPGGPATPPRIPLPGEGGGLHFAARFPVSLTGQKPPCIGATTPHAFPELIVRPAIRMRPGEYDITRDPRPRRDRVKDYDQAAPMVLRKIGWANQGAGSTTWTQTPKLSRWPGGTAGGGEAWLPPEMDLEDVEIYGGPRPGRSCSTSYIALWPDKVRLAWGKPRLVDGGITGGFQFYGVSESMIFEHVDTAGVSTTVVQFQETEITPSVDILPGTTGTLDIGSDAAVFAKGFFDTLYLGGDQVGDVAMYVNGTSTVRITGGDKVSGAGILQVGQVESDDANENFRLSANGLELASDSDVLWSSSIDAAGAKVAGLSMFSGGVHVTDGSSADGALWASYARLKEQASSPGTPATGTQYIYPKTDGFWYATDDTGTESQIGGGSGEVLQFDVNQTTHGFAVQDVIRHNGTSFTKAQADDQDTAGLWLVTAVADANNFTATFAGRATVTSHGLTVGEYYFLSAATAGLLTITEPTGASDVSNPMVFVEDANTLHVLPFRPSVPADGSGTANIVVDTYANRPGSPTDFEFFGATDEDALQVNISGSGYHAIAHALESDMHLGAIWSWDGDKTPRRAGGGKFAIIDAGEDLKTAITDVGAGGTIIVVGSATKDYTTAITVSNDDVWIIGYGLPTFRRTADVDFLTITGDRCRIIGLKLTENASGTNDLIRINAASDTVIERCQIAGADASPSSPSAGIALYDDGRRTRIHNCYITNMYSGIKASFTSTRAHEDFIFSNNHIICPTGGTACIRLDRDANDTWRMNGLIIGNWLDNQATGVARCIEVDGNSFSQITAGLVISSNVMLKAGTSGYCVGIHGKDGTYTAQDMTIIGNYMEGGQSQMYLEDCERVAAVGNTMNGSSSTYGINTVSTAASCIASGNTSEQAYNFITGWTDNGNV